LARLELTVPVAPGTAALALHSVCNRRAGLSVMHKMFFCSVSDHEGLRSQRYAASASHELEVREAMLRYLSKDFAIKSIREASDDEIRRHGPLPAGTITLLPVPTE